MSFHTSSVDIRVEGGHYLKARTRTAEGDHAESELNLNDFIGNEDGKKPTQPSCWEPSVKLSRLLIAPD